MQNFFDSLNELNTCYNKYSKEDVKNMTTSDFNSVCLQEKFKVAQNLFSDSMDTKNLINERLDIIKERNEDNLVLRRKLLD
mmetsp:Transcript_21499/g.22333  ORF Transcript_21499/g.22333 Transcript_21499/m.22333 type:complete len:81 (+) Transcript_21499:1039-1281(+)